MVVIPGVVRGENTRNSTCLAMWRGQVGVWLLLLGLSGCVGWAGTSSSPQRYERALQLVDEGTSRLRERRFAEADAAFSAASELAPLPAALDGSGCVALLTGDFSRAEGLFLAALELDTSYREAAANLALLMDLSGRHERALVLYNQYLSEVPEGGIVRNNRAVLEYERGGGTIPAAQEMAKVALFATHGVIDRNREALRRELARTDSVFDPRTAPSTGVSGDREFATHVRVQ